MKRRKKEYCMDCSNFYASQCDILGEPTVSAIEICKRCGYKMWSTKHPHCTGNKDHLAYLRAIGQIGDK